jgi:hypothetical protein
MARFERFGAREMANCTILVPFDFFPAAITAGRRYYPSIISILPGNSTNRNRSPEFVDTIHDTQQDEFNNKGKKIS